MYDADEDALTASALQSLVGKTIQHVEFQSCEAQVELTFTDGTKVLLAGYGYHGEDYITAAVRDV